MPLLDTDDTVICPYNKSHEILATRLANHLIKCRKQHPNSGLEICKWNYLHHVRKDEIESHLKSCPDRISMTENLGQSTMAYQAPDPLANVGKFVTSNDDWDCEPAVTYDPRRNAMRKHVVRYITNATKKERKDFRHEERQRLRKIESGEAPDEIPGLQPELGLRRPVVPEDAEKPPNERGTRSTLRTLMAANFESSKRILSETPYDALLKKKMGNLAI